MKKLNNCTVLIVDDAVINIDILVSALENDYDISVALDGESALETVKKEKPDLILLDINMPGIDGYEVCHRLKNSPVYKSIPIIFLTGLTSLKNKTKGFEEGAVDYITKPFEISEVKARVKTHLELAVIRHELKNNNELLEQRVWERTRELAITQEVTIHSLTSLAETRDNETGGHIMRTRHYIRILAQHLETNPRFAKILTPNYIELLFKTAPLHDIGKVGIPDRILLKPGKFTDEEFEIMKAHTTLGKEALDRAEKYCGVLESPDFIIVARDIIYAHHEKWDGSGYPQKLSGEDIPLSGRLMAIADVYDALVSNRVYRPPLSHKAAIKIIIDGRGSHFDPDILDSFLESKEQFKEISIKFADDKV
ncbi:MAG: response regulator [Desulfobacteraceae bacterium]|nr:response regulator [Desulfobacteraceae bacterium]